MSTFDERTTGLALSVIVVVGDQRQRAARALASVLEQSAIEEMEILVNDVGGPDAPPLPGSDDARVRVIRRDPDTLFAAARAEGVREARAPIVSFIEEHVEARPEWARTIIRAHEERFAAVGCSFESGNPKSGWSDTCFHISHGDYLPQRVDRGPAEWISGHNSSYKRDTLLRYGDRLETLLKCDIVLHWQMAHDGHALLFEPAARLAHRNENTFRSVARGIFLWNWCFSNVRAETFGWSVSRKIGYIARAPLIPWVRFVRTLVSSLRHGRPRLLQFLRDAPFVAAVNYCSAAGQVVGLVCDIEPGERAFSKFELNEPRLLRDEWLRTHAEFDGNASFAPR